MRQWATFETLRCDIEADVQSNLSHANIDRIQMAPRVPKFKVKHRTKRIAIQHEVGKCIQRSNLALMSDVFLHEHLFMSTTPPHKLLPQAARHREKSFCKYVRVKQHIYLCRSTHIERSIGLLDVKERSLTQTTRYLLALEIETRQSTRQGAA